MKAASRKERLQQSALVNLLVVDDLPQMREIIRSMLKANRYSSVITAQSGNEAMQMINSHPVDIIITDWNMPNMSGIELLKCIKRDSRLFRMAVMMISDEISADKVLYAVEEGVDGFLVKPFSEEKLTKSLREMLHTIIHADAVHEKMLEMKHLMLQGAHREALELGHETMKLRSHPRIALMLCECLYHVKEYEKAIDMIMDSEEESRTSFQNNLLGKSYMNIGKHSQGILYLEQAARKNPLNNDRKIDAARAHFSIGNIADAERQIAAVMSSNPTDLNMVDIAQLYLEIGNVDKAGEYLEKTVEPIPETVTVFNNYAIALRRANRYEDSIRIYKKCLQITPDSDILQYNLAVLYHTMNQYTEAKKILGKTLALNPDNRPAKDLLTRVSESLNEAR
jgi:two-component system chemotaxis response regulator CheY